MPGDNFFRSFPNVAPIRGARLRTPETWISSLDRVLALSPDHLVPSHTRPVLGAETARSTLTAYRDGLKSILDQTMEGIRKGERPDELAAHVKLPPALAANPFLYEFYGGVEWTVRGIYADSVGWFDGNATKLFPLPEKDRATRLVRLLGGVDRVLDQARTAAAAGDATWAAELADYVLVNDPADVAARRIKAQALTLLAEQQVNAIARNYYLTTAQYLLKGITPP
jgi:alkyl sulfatase BDS1-like metallo-beta-lactamase superfamily hydrolase